MRPSIFHLVEADNWVDRYAAWIRRSSSGHVRDSYAGSNNGISR